MIGIPLNPRYVYILVWFGVVMADRVCLGGVRVCHDLGMSK